MYPSVSLTVAICLLTFAVCHLTEALPSGPKPEDGVINEPADGGDDESEDGGNVGGNQNEDKLVSEETDPLKGRSENAMAVLLGYF